MIMWVPLGIQDDWDHAEGVPVAKSGREFK